MLPEMNQIIFVSVLTQISDETSNNFIDNINANMTDFIHIGNESFMKPYGFLKISVSLLPSSVTIKNER